jgi:hypothetical protein
LFLTVVFPIHIWTAVLYLRDFQWVAERTNIWDAIGVGSYGLVYAFSESIIVSIILLTTSLLIPTSWDEKKRFATLWIFFMVTAFWAILNQLFFILEMQIPLIIIRFLASRNHPLRLLYGALGTLVFLSLLSPFYLIARKKRAIEWIVNTANRISLLSIFYLFLDFLGLVIIIIRNTQTG